ncbi:MAG: ATP-binding cassette domain-containing protein [Chloroflexota bacterium]
MSAGATVEAFNLTKTYGRSRGVSQVSFEVPEGEVFGFLGPNGAGKTTTIRLLMGLLHPDSGSARVAGLDCWKQSVKLKHLVGYAPGEPALDADLTSGQILEYFGHLRGGVDQAYLRELVQRFELDTSRRFRHYSTGNKRKVVLIQAFMHRPRLLILDEPTNGLDPLNQQAFAQLVREARAGGSTIFLSSHVLSEVEQLCTRVGIIREGRLLRSGSVDDVRDIKHYDITLTFGTAVPEAVFDRLPGVARVEHVGAGHVLKLGMQGGPDAVIKAAAAYSVLSMTTHEPSLEDTFLRYYTDSPTPSEGSRVA